MLPSQQNQTPTPARGLFPTLTRRASLGRINGPSARGTYYETPVQPPPREQHGTGPRQRFVAWRNVWGHLKRLNAKIENCWIGDLLALSGLVTLLLIGLFFVGVYQ